MAFLWQSQRESKKPKIRNGATHKIQGLVKKAIISEEQGLKNTLARPDVPNDLPCSKTLPIDQGEQKKHSLRSH
jgi:hypothetical protein